MATFRPSARVRLQIRLEEFGDTEQLRSKLEREPPRQGSLATGGRQSETTGASAQDSNLAARRQLNRSRSVTPPADHARERSRLDHDRSLLQRQQGSSRSQEVPESLQERPDDQRNVIFAVLPLKLQISRNGIRDASTLDLELDFRDVPVDPRIIRSCLVSADIGTVSAGEHERGVLQQDLRDDGSLLSLIGREPGQELNFRSTTRFVGYADEWSTEWSEGDIISLTCRDLSALLRDQKIPSDAGIDMTLPIAQGVQQLVDRFESSRGLRVVFGTPTNPDDPLNVVVPDFGPIPAESIPKIKKSTEAADKAKASKRGDQRETVWDHIVDVTNLLGLVPVWRGFTLFLLEPRVLFSNFRGARRMVWGRNIKELSMARKLNGYQADTIEIRSPDPSIGRTRWARHPVLDGEPKSGILGLEGSPQPVTSRATKVSANGQPEETVRTYFVQSITDQKVLERIAENTFDEVGRQEIEGALLTHDIESFESTTEADLLALEPGEPVSIEVAPPAEVSSAGNELSKPSNTSSNLQELRRQSVAERARYLQSLGMSADSAGRLAAAQEGVELISTFRAGHVNIDWSHADGVSVEIDFHNFIVIREKPDETSGQPSPGNLSEGAAL